ncbi:MAG TPA: periplasmic heavy metal sensor [Candidatus Acidoferrales bacterium]|nr:periplasmic heavy metal sensor [Candidatus Acidoferrales bacterium]
MRFYSYGVPYPYVGPAPSRPPPSAGYDYAPQRRTPAAESDFEKPLVSLMLERRAELELSPDQVEELERLRHEFEREAIRFEADLRIAEIDLQKLLKEEPVNLHKVEDALREIERLRADQRLARIRAIEQGKALLSAEQREKLANLAGSNPPPAVSEGARY